MSKKTTNVEEVKIAIKNAKLPEEDSGRVTIKEVDEIVQRQIDRKDAEWQQEFDRKQTEVDGAKDDNSARKKYASYLFLLLIVWLGVVIGIVIATGIGWYKLSDTVLIALITTTTANIAGFFLIVTQYLFKKQ